MKISKWSKKKLQEEYQSICQTIEHCGYSCRDLMYRDNLEREIDKRGYEIYKSYKLS